MSCFVDNDKKLVNKNKNIMDRKRPKLSFRIQSPYLNNKNKCFRFVKNNKLYG